MEFFAGPSFQEGNGSSARETVVVKATAKASAEARRLCVPVLFMVLNLR
jgi:hypothetical protein